MEADRITTKMKSVKESIMNLRKKEKEEDSERKWKEARRKEVEARRKEENAVYKRMPGKIKKLEKNSCRGVDHTDEWGRFHYKREGDQRTVSIKIVPPEPLILRPAPILTVPVEIRRMHQALCEMTKSNDITSRGSMQININNGDIELETSFDSFKFEEGKNSSSDLGYMRYGAVDKENGDALLSVLNLGKTEFEAQVAEAVRKDFGITIKLPKKRNDNPLIVFPEFSLASNPAMIMTVCLTNKQQYTPDRRNFTLFDSSDCEPVTVNNLILKTMYGHSVGLNLVTGLAQIFYEGHGSGEDDKHFYIHGGEVTKPVSISINDGAAKYVLEHGIAKRERDYERNKLDGMCSLEITSSTPIKTENVEKLLTLLRTPET